MIKNLLFIILFLLLEGCMIYPARTVAPLKAQVVDAQRGNPIKGADFLRIVCDIHDRDCGSGQMDRGKSNDNGMIIAEGKREWGLYLFVPGGMPVPDHYIAVWKEGYRAFVFSQYGSHGYDLSNEDHQDMAEAIKEIPTDRNYFTPRDIPKGTFTNGKIKLYKLE